MLFRGFQKIHLEIVEKAARRVWMELVVPMRDSMDALKLKPGDNQLADYMKEVNMATQHYWDVVEDILKSLPNQFSTSADIERMRGFINDANTKRKALADRMPQEYLSYALRNDLPPSANRIDLAKQDAQIDSTLKAVAALRRDRTAAANANNAGVAEINAYVEGPMKKMNDEMNTLFKNLHKSNYDATERRLKEMSDQIVQNLDRLIAKYDKVLTIEALAQLTTARVRVADNYRIKVVKSAVRD